MLGHVNSGELSAIEVRKAHRSELEYLKQLKVVERVLYSFIKHRTGKEAIEVRWTGTLGNQRDAREQAGGEGVPPQVRN